MGLQQGNAIGSIQFSENNWTWYQDKIYAVAQQLVTLAGTTQTVSLNIPIGFRLHRISQFFSAANARTFNIRVFSAPTVNKSAYEEIESVTASTALSDIALTDPSEFEYITPVTIQFNYSSYTATDTIAITVFITLI